MLQAESKQLNEWINDSLIKTLGVATWCTCKNNHCPALYSIPNLSHFLNHSHILFPYHIHGCGIAYNIYGKSLLCLFLTLKLKRPEAESHWLLLWCFLVFLEEWKPICSNMIESSFLIWTVPLSRWQDFGWLVKYFICFVLHGSMVSWRGTSDVQWTPARSTRKNIWWTT